MSQETKEIRQMRRAMCVGVTLAMAATFAMTINLLPQSVEDIGLMWSDASRVLAEGALLVLSVGALAFGFAITRLMKTFAVSTAPRGLSARPLLLLLPILSAAMAIVALYGGGLQLCLELLPFQTAALAGNVFLLAAFQDLAWVRSLEIIEENAMDERENFK